MRVNLVGGRGERDLMREEFGGKVYLTETSIKMIRNQPYKEWGKGHSKQIQYFRRP